MWCPNGRRRCCRWSRTGLIPKTFILKCILVCSDGLENDDRLSGDLFAEKHTVAKRHESPLTFSDVVVCPKDLS